MNQENQENQENQVPGTDERLHNGRTVVDMKAKAYKTINRHSQIENEIDKAISDRDAKAAKAADTLGDRLNADECNYAADHPWPVSTSDPSEFPPTTQPEYGKSHANCESYLVGEDNKMQNCDRDKLILSALYEIVGYILAMFRSLLDRAGLDVNFELYINTTGVLPVKLSIKEQIHSKQATIIIELTRWWADKVHIKKVDVRNVHDKITHTFYECQFPDTVTRHILDFMLKRAFPGYEFDAHKGELLTQLLNDALTTIVTLKHEQRWAARNHRDQMDYKSLHTRNLEQQLYKSQRRFDEALNRLVNGEIMNEKLNARCVELTGTNYSLDMANTSLTKQVAAMELVKRENESTIRQLQSQVHDLRLEIQMLNIKPKQRSTPRDLSSRPKRKSK